MANFMQFTLRSFEKTVYVNRDFITSFRYDELGDHTVIDLPGADNYYEVLGDQTQKILDGWRDADG